MTAFREIGPGAIGVAPRAKDIGTVSIFHIISSARLAQGVALIGVIFTSVIARLHLACIEESRNE